MNEEQIAEKLRQTRIQTILALAETYSFPAMPVDKGYYGGFLSRLCHVFFGACKDYGMKPDFFILLSQMQPLGEALGGVAVLAENPTLRSKDFLLHVLRKAVENLESDEALADFSV